MLLLNVLSYLHHDRFRGVKYNGADNEHGINQLYCYADANLQVPRSRGCYALMINDAAIELKSQLQTIIQICTAATEITECVRCALGAVAIRNLLEEMGLWQNGATVIYQDNQPAIRIAYNEGSMTQRTRHLDLRTLKIRQLCADTKEIVLKYCKTKRMLVDLGTKIVPEPQFVYMRDALCGYTRHGSIIPEGADWKR